MRRSTLLLTVLLVTGACRRQPAAPLGPPPQFVANSTGATDVCGALLPGALSLPGPPAVQPADRPVRVVAFGDFGEDPGTRRNTLQPQRDVAAAMVRHGPYDLGLALGDNFYPKGLTRVDDPRWRTQWENLYTPLGLRFYVILGNHDYKNAPASTEAEIAYTRSSRTWCLPQPYYTFTAGPVQFFAVDTTPLEEPRRAAQAPATMAEQKEWLEKELAASQAPWKVVYGHHPIYTNGEHGNDHGRGRGTLPAVRDYLLPLLQAHKVDVYLAGHDHDLQALKPEGGVHFFISGGGGRYIRPLLNDQCRKWAKSSYGFAVLAADSAALKVTFHGRRGEILDETVLQKGVPVADCPRPR